MAFEREALEFILEHRDADRIVIDTKTGLPVYAEYLHDSSGRRSFPAKFYFEGCYEDEDP